MKPTILGNIDPVLAADLKMRLKTIGEASLAAQVDYLPVVFRNEHRYGSDFYMRQPQKEPWGPSHKTLSLRPGVLHVDIVDGEIVMVEVIRRPDIAVNVNASL